MARRDEEQPTPHEAIAFWDGLRRRGARLEFPPGGRPLYHAPPGTTRDESARQMEVLSRIWPVLLPALRPRAAGPKDITALRAESVRAYTICKALLDRLRAGKPRLRPDAQLPPRQPDSAAGRNTG